MLCTNLVVKQLYTDVQLLNSLFSKGLRKGYFIMVLLKILNVSERTGCPWFHAVAMFLWNKNSRPEVYTEVHFWTGYFQKAYGKFIFNVRQMH